MERRSAKAVYQFLSSKSALTVTGMGLAVVALLGYVDYITGWEISFSIFYLIPISAVAWFAGRRCGLLVSVAAAITWFLAEQAWPHFYGWIPYWNAAVRFGFFVIVTLTLSSVQAAREKQKELTDFVVHDLRSPMTNVMAGLKLLDSVPGATLHEAQKELVETAVISGERMLTLINSLLDVSRLESGEMPLQVEDVNPSELVKAALEQVALWALHSGATITPQLDPQAGAVRADRSVTVRILVNLLGNAIKVSRPGASVFVRCTPHDPAFLAFSVIDQGPGVPEEWAHRVFDKFVQVEARKGGAAFGSGLGLTFCHAAVRAQGGRIWLESEEGKGTAVRFTLPVARAAPP